MTAYVSAANGDWATSSTWTPSGSPGIGDTFTISGHAVSINSDVTVGTSPVAGTVIGTIQSSGSLSIAGAAVFKVRGDLTLNNCPLTLGSGAIYEFDSSAAASPSTTNYKLHIGTAHNQTSARLNLNGSSGQYVTVRSNASGGFGAVTDGTGPWLQGGLITGDYVNFTRVGNSSLPAWTTSPTGSASSTLTHARFDTCGKVTNTYNLGATCTFTLGAHFTATASTECLTVINGSGYTSGTRLLQDCSFDKDVQLYTSAGIQLSNVVCAGSITNTVGGTNWVSATNVAFLAQNNHLGGSITDFACLVTATDNPHYLQPNCNSGITIDGGVFEGYNLLNTSDAGDCISATNTGSTFTCTVQNCIDLPGAGGGVSSGVLVSMLGDSFQTYSVQHCTGYLTANDPTSNHPALVGVGESFSQNAGQLGYLRSCIMASNASRNAALLRNINGTVHDDVVSPSNFDYNCYYNVSHYEGQTFSSTPGAHTLNVDPGFYDPSRKLATWDASLGGPGTAANAITELKKLGSATYNTAYTVAAYIAYVRAGFAPTNSSLSTAAHDGTTIGAVAYSAASNNTATLATAPDIAVTASAGTAAVTSNKTVALSTPVNIVLSGSGGSSTVSPPPSQGYRNNRSLRRFLLRRR